MYMRYTHMYVCTYHFHIRTYTLCSVIILYIYLTSDAKVGMETVHHWELGIMFTHSLEILVMGVCIHTATITTQCKLQCVPVSMYTYIVAIAT